VIQTVAQRPFERPLEDDFSEQGCWSASPDYSTNRTFYVYYVRKTLEYHMQGTKLIQSIGVADTTTSNSYDYSSPNTNHDETFNSARIFIFGTGDEAALEILQ
jgi:hypothetical protein